MNDVWRDGSFEYPQHMFSFQEHEMLKVSYWDQSMSKPSYLQKKNALKVNSYTAPPILTKIQRDYDHKRNLFQQDQNHFYGNTLSIVEKQRV